MKKNRANKSKEQINKEMSKLRESFSRSKDNYNRLLHNSYFSMFEHITMKHICLQCNRVESHEFKCCEKSYPLGKVVRTPKKKASKSKWKKFFTYLSKFRPRLLEEHQHLVDKYNIDKTLKWDNTNYGWNTTKGEQMLIEFPKRK